MSFASNLIKAEETFGRLSVIKSQRLPARIDHLKPFDESVEALRRWGVSPVECEFTAGLENCPSLFLECTMPDGWHTAPTEHSMWNALLDEKGNERAEFFYKSSPWDNRAFLRVTFNRFEVRRNEDDREAIQFAVWAKGRQQPIKSFNSFAYAELGDGGKLGLVELDGSFEIVNAWLAADVTGEKSEAKFSKATKGLTATFLARDEFYEKHHWIKPCYEFIDASINQAKKAAKAFVETLPKGDAQWDWENPKPSQSSAGKPALT